VRLRNSSRAATAARSRQRHPLSTTFEKLAALRDKGIISDAEFEAKKKQIHGV
jgi:hypothetical protein